VHVAAFLNINVGGQMPLNHFVSDMLDLFLVSFPPGAPRLIEGLRPRLRQGIEKVYQSYLREQGMQDTIGQRQRLRTAMYNLLHPQTEDRLWREHYSFLDEDKTGSAIREIGHALITLR